MTLGEAYRHGIVTLNNHAITDSQFESRVLICHVLDLPSSALYTNSECLLPEEAFTRFEALLTRRLAHEPAAYITGYKEFYGIQFFVDRNVLIPRPETELLVDEALRACAAIRGRMNRAVSVADIGTGSGAIAISLALHATDLELYAVDRSGEALSTARKNARAHMVERNISFLQGDLLSPLPVMPDVVVANLPYVADSAIPGLAPEIYLHEPHLALRGGERGLDLIEKMLSELGLSNMPPAIVLLEIGADHRVEISSLVKRMLPNARFEFIKDGYGYDRVVRITFPHDILVYKNN